jgi:hypothetical protein
MAWKLDGEGPEMSSHQIFQGTRILIVLLGVFFRFHAEAHVGSPKVFFDGYAGPYRTHIVVRPAEVIPGLAEISVRVESGEVTQVTALPMKWNTGRKGAPPPDIAKRVRGESNLYTAQLWFMESGAHGIEIGIQGEAGAGAVIVPVNADATRVLTMPQGLGYVLVGLGVLLLALLVSIIGAAARESVVDPGMAVPLRRIWWGRGVMTAAFAILAFLLWGGKHWWEAEAADYRNNLLSRPLETQAKVQVAGANRVLRIEVPEFDRGAPPLVPDHGKLMHLFMVREPGLDAFAHLHPVKVDKKTYSALLPDLPAGRYRFYADVTFETGWSETLTNSVEMPKVSLETAASITTNTIKLNRMDEDDAWNFGSENAAAPGKEFLSSVGCLVRFINPKSIRANRNVDLKFAAQDEGGRALNLEPYLGMTGHLVVMRHDGAVFTHLHPGGSASMAAMQLSALRAEGKLPLRVALGKEDPICKLPEPGKKELAWLNGAGEREGEVAFPYAFPKEGEYRLWLQVRVKGRVQTAVFDLDVQGAENRSTEAVAAR